MVDKNAAIVSLGSSKMQIERILLVQLVLINMFMFNTISSAYLFGYLFIDLVK